MSDRKDNQFVVPPNSELEISDIYSIVKEIAFCHRKVLSFVANINFNCERVLHPVFSMING